VKTSRPLEFIRHELATARALHEKYAAKTFSNPFAIRMREDNEREINELETELRAASAGDLEVSLDGDPVDDHRVTLPYFNKVTESLQAAVRAVYRSLKPDGSLRRGEAVLAIAGTAPGSFKVSLVTPPQQLDLLEQPLIDQTLASIVGLLQAVGQDNEREQLAGWASRAAEPSLRAMIRLASALAGSRGVTSVRWRDTAGREQTATVPAASARALAAALAGQTGREVIEVVGHLRLAQDEPPRAGIRTIDDDYSATIPSDDLLEKVKELLFEEVRATLVVDMRTSPTTGRPATFTELVDLDAAEPVTTG
jgi:hypothetical protein